MNRPTVLGFPRPVKLTVDDFAVLHAAGALESVHHAELIEGTVTEMSPQRRRHSFVKNELTYRLRQALERAGSRYTAQSEVTVAMPPHNAPEPDIVVTDAPDGDDYMPVSSVALVVEVADSSIAHDLGDKRRLYAAAGIAEYWVVDVARREMHRFWGPTEGDYGEADRCFLSGGLASMTQPGLTIDGAGIL